MVVELKICIFWPLKLQFLKEPFPEIFRVKKITFCKFDLFKPIPTVRGSVFGKVD